MIVLKKKMLFHHSVYHFDSAQLEGVKEQEKLCQAVSDNPHVAMSECGLYVRALSAVWTVQCHPHRLLYTTL